jgi:hypothetical protein
MAIRYECDGCGEAVEKPQKVGRFSQKEYCDKCAVVAQEFLDELDKAHTEMAAAWATAVSTIRMPYLGKLKAFPDGA